jgi:beta-lactamase class D
MPAGIGSASPTPEAPASEAKPELEKYFQGFKGAFVLYDLNGNNYIRYNPERCAERFIPASTFKIMNSLIGLETGVIPDENYVIKWDGTHNVIPSWNQDHTLKTAIKNSVVWYYQELARRVGKEKMQHYIEIANYGNKDISGQIDTFWLEGGLRISANEQVEFLKRLYKNELPFSSRSVNIVKEILVLEKTESYQLSGKTGSGQRITPHEGWFVGYLETKGNVYFFATNFESSSPDGLANGDTAQKISLNILRGLELLP